MFYFLFILSKDSDPVYMPEIVRCPSPNTDDAARLLQQRHPGWDIYVHRLFIFDRATGKFSKLELPGKE